MRVRLEDVCEKESSKLKQSDVIDQNGLYPVYGASGYLGSINTYQQSNYYVAVVKDGAGIGRTMLLPPKSSIIGTMQYLIPKDNVQPEYLYYVVKAKHLEKYFSGATIPHIYFKDYKNEQFDLVSFEKQRDIINRLKKIEIIIDSLSKILVLLDELVRARFVEMFGDPIENQKDWEVVKIRDIVTDVRYGTSKPAVEGGRYPYLRMNNLTVDGGLDLSDLKYIDIPDNEIEKCVVRKGDILFNRTNSIDLIGKTAVFNLLDDMVIAGYIIRIRLNNQILPDVFSQYMNLEAMKKVLRGMAKGAVNQANINAQELQSIKVYVPDMKLQKQYVEFKEEVDKSRSRIQKSLEASQELFDSLMQEYFG